nr:hypothetical protein [Tanacetum cinerariifolium]
MSKESSVDERNGEVVGSGGDVGINADRAKEGTIVVSTIQELVGLSVSTSIGYGVSNFLSNTAYSFKKINMAYLVPLNTTKHFKTLSLDESISPDFDLFSDQEEYSKEEVAKTMAKTIEQYMSKTRADYGSGIARPKMEDNDSFELQGQFLKELCDNTFSATIQAQLNNLGSEIKKMNEKVYAAQVGCEQCKGPYYTKDCPLKEEGKTLKEAYYAQFGAPFQGGDIEQLVRDSIKGTT